MRMAPPYEHTGITQEQLQAHNAAQEDPDRRIPPAQLLAENFAAAAAPGLPNEIAIVMPRPWSSGEAPPGIFAPLEGQDGLDPGVPAQIQARRASVLVPVSVDEPDEQLVADRVIPCMSGDTRTCVLMALIFPPGLELDHDTNSRVIAKYSRILGLGFDEVLVDPSTEPDELRRAVGVSQSMLELNGRRMQFMLQTEAEPVTHEQLQKLRSQHRRLLWESIPHSLMPYFAPLNRQLVEGPRNLDRYRLIRRMDSVKGRLLLALDETRKAHVVKVIDKNNITALGQLECVYREYRFLSQIIRHPSITHCVEMLHSPTHLYLVFELAGNTNLLQVLQSMPGQRLDEPLALEVFSQIGSGLVYCHAQSISHRQISLPHIVVQPNGMRYHCVLVDFHKAMMVRGKCTSRTVCGSLPCIAPEMALGKAYVPCHVDCWSFGAVLLEAAGGLGSMSRFVGYDEQSPDTPAAATKQLELFAVEGSHAAALACVGAVNSRAVTLPLQQLMQPEPGDRAEVRKVVAAIERSNVAMAQRVEAVVNTPELNQTRLRDPPREPHE